MISIIVPVYNVEKYLTRCIDSILSQSFSDYELILIDDESPDECGKICDDYAKRDSRIRVVHQKNGGSSKARNVGLDIAKGDFIAFIDSDDFILPFYLENLYRLCLDNDADISSCSFSSDITVDEKKEKRFAGISEVYRENKMETYLTTKKIETVPWAKLYKKKLFESLRYPVGKYNEDVYTTCLLIHRANKVAVNSYKGYIYRNNPCGMTNEKYSQKKMHAVEATMNRADFIRTHYPTLTDAAFMGVIYACNQVVFSMGKSRINDEKNLRYIQNLYRNFCASYLKSKASFKGKFFSLLAFFDIRVAWFLSRFF